MLKNLKNKDSKGKKDAKKETKAKQVKQPAKQEEQFEKQDTTDLVDVSELKKDETKAKVGARKRNENQLEQRQIDISTITIVKQKQPQRKTWAANSVQEVMRKDFKMQNIEHEFMSLTDQNLNQKILQKRKQEEEKQKTAKVVVQNNLNVRIGQKSKDQERLQRVQIELSIKPSSNLHPISGISMPTFSFTNSNSNVQSTNYKPIQKTPQQLRMEQAERKEQQMALKKPTTSWIGTKKTQEKQKPAFKTSAWVTAATQSQQTVQGDAIKFAPINPVQQKEPAKRVETNNNGLKFAPLQPSKQEQKFRQSDRRQQQFVFVSKKEQQQRRKKREEQKTVEQVKK